MDRGAWQAAVHRVTKSRTRLNWLSTHTCRKVERHETGLYNPNVKLVFRSWPYLSLQDLSLAGSWSPSGLTNRPYAVTCVPFVSLTLDVTEERASKVRPKVAVFHLPPSVRLLSHSLWLFSSAGCLSPFVSLRHCLNLIPFCTLYVTSMHTTPKPLYSDLNVFLCCTLKCLFAGHLHLDLLHFKITTYQTRFDSTCKQLPFLPDMTKTNATATRWVKLCSSSCLIHSFIKYWRVSTSLGHWGHKTEKDKTDTPEAWGQWQVCHLTTPCFDLRPPKMSWEHMGGRPNLAWGKR